MRKYFALCCALGVGALSAGPSETCVTPDQAVMALRQEMLDPQSQSFKALQCLAQSRARNNNIAPDAFEVVQAQRALDALLGTITSNLVPQEEAAPDSQKLLREFMPLYGVVLQLAVPLDKKSRHIFLDNVLNTALAAQAGGAISPDELIANASKLFGGTKLLTLHARHQEAALHALVATLALYVAYKGVQWWVVKGKQRTFDSKALLHYIFGHHVDSVAEGVIDACFTPAQLMRHPVATPIVKPLLSAAVLGASVGLGARALITMK